MIVATENWAILELASGVLLKHRNSSPAGSALQYFHTRVPGSFTNYGELRLVLGAIVVLTVVVLLYIPMQWSTWFSDLLVDSGALSYQHNAQ